MFVVILLIILATGVIIYAVLETLKSPKNELDKKKVVVHQGALALSDLELKNTRLQRRIVVLENELAHKKLPKIIENDQDFSVKETQQNLSHEIKRREEWLAKAEAELAKIKAENIVLTNRFIAKEKELNEEFAKDVDISRQLRELKAAFDAKEIACRLKEDQVQAQKHQIESQLKVINEQLASIAEFQRKEKISEWVPKVEFNELYRKYLSLEKQIKENKNQQEKA
jgi:hypothetical protein